MPEITFFFLIYLATQLKDDHELLSAFINSTGCQGLAELLEQNYPDNLFVLILAGIIREYETIAAAAGWTTQKTCQVDFDNLPGANKVTMLKVADAIRQKYIKNSF